MSKIYNYFVKPKRIPWHIRFCLWFCKPIYSTDPAYPICTLVFKSFRGKLYFLKEFTYKENL